MRVCKDWQIPHSQYLGGPPAWTPLDRAKAEALADFEAALCQMCGTNPDWFDPEKGGHRYAMIAESWRCPGCELEAQLREQIPHAEKGVHVRLIPNPDVVSHG